MAITINEWQQVEHVARLAVLAMAARGVAQAEAADHPEVSRLVITVSDLGEHIPAVDVEFFGSSSVPLGGLSI